MKTTEQISEAERSAGEVATEMVVDAFYQKAKRFLGNQKTVVKVPQEVIEAYAIQILRKAIEKVDGEEIPDIDEKRMGEISLLLVKHRFQKGN